MIEERLAAAARVPAAHVDPRAHVRAAVRRGRRRRRRRARCSPRPTARTCSSSRSTTAGTGSATTTCCATCCRRELARRDRALLRDLHARASAWHWRAGDVDEAITHAIAAGEIESASDMIAAHWQPAVQSGPRTVARWLDALGRRASIEADARLCIARGWTSMFTGPLRARSSRCSTAAERNPLRGAAPDVARLARDARSRCRAPRSPTCAATSAARRRWRASRRRGRRPRPRCCWRA